MGAWRYGKAVALAALLRATPAAAGTVLEPIARLYLEGGYDSNALYDGRSGDQVGRISPEAGLKFHDPLYDLGIVYGGEYVRYQKLAPSGYWNQRGGLKLDARPTPTTTVAGELRLSQATDPVALAQAGVFRTGFVRAFLVTGRARAELEMDERTFGAATYQERTVIFQDATGGAMHAPGVEVLRRVDRRFSLGGAYALGVFQSFIPGGASDQSLSNAVRARARWRVERHVSLDAWAGPAVWLPRAGHTAVVPEFFAEVLVATRGLDLRVNGGHALGLGATAQPGIVDSLEVGGERRFGRTWFVRGDGGLWRSGAVPDGAYAVTGYAVAGEAGRILAGGLRLSVTGAHFARADSSDPAYRRSKAGLRLSWELQAR
jgi:hypothetical protein